MTRMSLGLRQRRSAFRNKLVARAGMEGRIARPATPPSFNLSIIPPRENLDTHLTTASKRVSRAAVNTDNGNSPVDGQLDVGFCVSPLSQDIVAAMTPLAFVATVSLVSDDRRVAERPHTDLSQGHYRLALLPPHTASSREISRLGSLPPYRLA